MMRQVTVYNNFGQQMVMNLNDGDEIIYDRYQNPSVLPAGHDYTESKEGWITTFPKNSK